MNPKIEQTTYRLKLTYEQLITLKSFYFRNINDSTDGDIHEKLQDYADAYHHKRGALDVGYKEFHTFKFDWTELVNIQYFCKSRSSDDVFNQLYTMTYKKNRN